MIVRMWEATILPGRLDDGRRLGAPGPRPPCSHHPGCLAAEILRHDGIPERVALLTRWDTPPRFEEGWPGDALASGPGRSSTRRPEAPADTAETRTVTQGDDPARRAAAAGIRRGSWRVMSSWWLSPTRERRCDAAYPPARPRHAGARAAGAGRLRLRGVVTSVAPVAATSSAANDGAVPATPTATAAGTARGSATQPGPGEGIDGDYSASALGPTDAITAKGLPTVHFRVNTKKPVYFITIDDGFASRRPPSTTSAPGGCRSRRSSPTPRSAATTPTSRASAPTTPCRTTP